MQRRFPFTVSATIAIALALGSCAGGVNVVPESARPIPVPTPTPAPQPAPAPTPVRPAAGDWRDWPLTPGSWSYRQDARGSIALFGRAGSDADLTLRCDRSRARVYLSRRGDVGGPLTIRTSSTLRTFNAVPTGGTPAYLAVELEVRDSLLDAIGFSRGRFVIEGAGLPALAIPTWAELLRVVEDCR
ncbi:MAG: hypothetical protein V4574_20880 [Pseudomonadota bacterium]